MHVVDDDRESLMQLTKFTHSCVRLDDGDRRLVIDPGVFSEVETGARRRSTPC